MIVSQQCGKRVINQDNIIHNGGLTLLKELKQLPGFKLNTSGPPLCITGAFWISAKEKNID